MSIGPKTKEEEGLKTGIIQSLQYSAKKFTETYFNDPIHYLFYGSLAGLVIGLLLNQDFSWKFYLLVFCLMVAEFFIKTWVITI